MTPAMMRTGDGRRRLAPAVLALTLAAIVGAAWTAPAQAEERDRGHEVNRGHHHRDWHGASAYVAPGYVYAPPPVYYAAPEAPPAINFVFPLRIR
jgi:hypothetical protein